MDKLQSHTLHLFNTNLYCFTPRRIHFQLGEVHIHCSHNTHKLGVGISKYSPQQASLLVKFPLFFFVCLFFCMRNSGPDHPERFYSKQRTRGIYGVTSS